MTLTNEGFEALQDAVRIARDERVSRLKTLRACLLARGHEEGHIDEAIRYWAGHVKRNPT